MYVYDRQLKQWSFVLNKNTDLPFLFDVFGLNLCD